MNPNLLHLTSFPTTIFHPLKKIGPLGLIVLLHLLLFSALKSGLINRVMPTQPKEIFASLITPEHPPAPSVPKTTTPKVVKLAKPSVTPPRPTPLPMPVPNTPSPTAIATASTPPQEASPPVALPTATSTSPAVPKTVTSGVEYIANPPPTYPSVSKRMGEEGKVELRVVINEKGLPDSVTVKKSSGWPRLDEAARVAVLRWIFKPYMENGISLRVAATVPLAFRLNN
ncbi:TonB family protein [Herbaspirillum sp. RTI4]|uniref:energy transducer TonB n=1 Tax=Herbaspirillum sp. RTI4 TaxID=3048640 RepID=UPI002AB5294E|nr:TonB family protein [Herbaspirillum sp. RTI4]MDY7576778.1 TonB family protein [Herbaspirillum sp. RTI4]MEA9981374.1 TonB family protein [Herbaspirillum sp. RTI4]